MASEIEVPELPKVLTDPNNVTIKAGSFVSVGGRQYQEDRVVVVHDLNMFCDPSERDAMSATRRSFFAIFDGHGGFRCSEFLCKNFHKMLAVHPKLKFSPLAALQDTWAGMETAILADFQRKAHQEKGAIFPHDGSTATICLIIDNDCYITNCGDSAACVQYSNGHVQKATEDHGTLNEAEITRCTDAGAHFQPQTIPATCACIPGCAKRVPVGKPRLYPGGLLVTRAFGDFFAKLPIYGGIQEALIAKHGDIEYFELSTCSSNIKNETASLADQWTGNMGQVAPDEKPSKLVRYIILASDGVWDAYSPVDVCKYLTSVRDSPGVRVMPLPPLDEKTGFPHFTTLGTADEEHLVFKQLARSICRHAVTSNYWSAQGCAPDNTSCIVIEVSEPANTGETDGSKTRVTNATAASLGSL